MITTVVTFHPEQECLLICDAVDKRFPPCVFIHIHCNLVCDMHQGYMIYECRRRKLLNVVEFDFDRPFSSLSTAKQTSPKQARRTVNITNHINGSSAQTVLSTGTAVSLNRA